MFSHHHYRMHLDCTFSGLLYNKAPCKFCSPTGSPPKCALKSLSSTTGPCSSDSLITCSNTHCNSQLPNAEQFIPTTDLSPRPTENLNLLTQVKLIPEIVYSSNVLVPQDACCPTSPPLPLSLSLSLILRQSAV